MQLVITSTELIKPSSPTPPHRRLHKLCFFDQSPHNVYMPVVLFYMNKSSYEDDSSEANFSNQLAQLKNSLSETLSLYYPLAGRIADISSVDCNDEGALLLEARMTCQLNEILKRPKFETLDLMLGDNIAWKQSKISIPLVVQVTLFHCGGMAIGLCISHRLMDLLGMSIFIRSWVARCWNSDYVEVTPPDFSAASIFPRGDLPAVELEFHMKKCATRRFVFDAGKIASLKASVADKVPNPTRFEVVAALLYKCAVLANRASSGSPKQTVFVVGVNLRPRMVPPLLDNLVGNIDWFCPILTRTESELTLEEIVKKKRERLALLCEVEVKNLSEKGWFPTVSSWLKESGEIFSIQNLVAFYGSSCCRIPLYEANFGWGKPTWVSTGSGGLNCMVFMDTKEGNGIEVLVNLEEAEMEIFERDEELLAYASCNPSVLDAA